MIARQRFTSILALTLTACITPHALASNDADGLDLFERSIRPVLVEHCHACHSADAKAIKGGLRVDSRAGLLAGGDSGPAVVPGKPDESLILEALRHEGLAMPPRGKLPDRVAADFERWITLGAPDPRTEPATPATARPATSLEQARNHWAYQPPRRHPLPPVANTAWPRNIIDRFILASLEAHNLRPAPEADRATLIRRLTFDLHGLPPTPDEIAAFEADSRPDAYERLVDRLLASPRFGERWGRHWLDVARFAESLTLRGFVFPNAWRYRDYVVDTFNADRPYDTFLREQIAGDLIGGPDWQSRRRAQIATTYLVLGNINLEEQDKAQLRMDAVDEQLDAIGKGILAQTISCARCHDHKFDPIPTRDYYALAGILANARMMEHANVSKWLEFPLPDSPSREAKLAAHEARLSALTQRIEALRKTAGATASGPLAPSALPGLVVDDTQARKVGEWTHSTHSGTYIGDGYVHDANAAKGARSLTFAPELPATGRYEFWLAYSPGTNRARAVPVTIMSADGETNRTVDMTAPPPLAGRFLKLGNFLCEKTGQTYVLVANDGTAGHVTPDAVVFLPEGAGPLIAGPVDTSELQPLEAELKQLKARGPRRDMVMSVAEEPQITDTRIHIRGSVHTLGDPAPRGFLTVATLGDPPSIPSGESGRRELAEWLASPANPLTARVFANRAWHWLLGVGLVSTPDNFGTTGEPPSHPELLDHLALQFIQQGWSTKALVREIVTTSTYRQSSDHIATDSDPQNRLLAHASRRRLDAECLRDAMLTASGTLQNAMGGRTFPETLAADYGYRDDPPRRSVYVPVFRNALPELFDAFDFADPSQVVGQRNTSTVAPQALYLLNHPFVLAQSRAAASQLLAQPHLETTHDRIQHLFLTTLGRRPTSAELQIALESLNRHSPPSLDDWTRLTHALFASIDFRTLR